MSLRRADAQAHMARAYEHLDLAEIADRNGSSRANINASLAAAHASLAGLCLTAFAQEKNGVPKEQRIDAVVSRLYLEAQREVSHG